MLVFFFVFSANHNYEFFKHKYEAQEIEENQNQIILKKDEVFLHLTLKKILMNIKKEKF